MSALEISIPDRTLARSARRVLFASAVAATAAAWLWLGCMETSHSIHAVLLMPHGRSAGGRSFLWAVMMWQAMTVAMMTPTFLRWLTTFATLTSRLERGGSTLRSAAALAGGYFAAWLVYSLAAAATQAELQQIGLLQKGRLVAAYAALLLIFAGLFQFAPIKRACLAHCRNPLTYFLSRWRNGPSGGFRLGALHGSYCIGCCWLLMVTGFAMGVMNMAWMAALTILIAIEQMAPLGGRIARALGIGLVGWGLALLL